MALLNEPPNRQTVTQLSYHNIMRLEEPELKEAIFYSCQLIIEVGRLIPAALKAAEEKGVTEGDEWLEVRRRFEG